MPSEFPFVRGAFDPQTTSVLIAAFEAAWETVEKSGSPLAAPDIAASTRELLAKFILAAAETGERDPKKLTDDALSRLITSR